MYLLRARDCAWPGSMDLVFLHFWRKWTELHRWILSKNVFNYCMTFLERWWVVEDGGRACFLVTVVMQLAEVHLFLYSLTPSPSVIPSFGVDVCPYIRHLEFTTTCNLCHSSSLLRTNTVTVHIYMNTSSNGLYLSFSLLSISIQGRLGQGNDAGCRLHLNTWALGEISNSYYT